MVADRGCPRSIDNVGKSAYFAARYWRFPCQAFMKSPPACNCTDLVVHEEMPENFRIYSAFHEPFLLVELPWGDEKFSTTLRHRCFRPSADRRLCVTGLLLTYEHVRRSSAPGGSTAGIREQRQLKRQFGNSGERHPLTGTSCSPHRDLPFGPHCVPTGRSIGVRRSGGDPQPPFGFCAPPAAMQR